MNRPARSLNTPPPQGPSEQDPPGGALGGAAIAGALASTARAQLANVGRARRAMWLGAWAALLSGAVDVAAYGASVHSSAVFLWGHLSLALLGGVLFAAGGHALRHATQPDGSARLAGRYVLKDLLGSGGMGEVWSAYHPALKRHVAVKILRRECMTPPLISRFEREIRAMTLLSHPNTVRILDCGSTDEGLLYYAMELLGGETLGALVARDGPLPPLRAIHIVRQAARALAEAHARGIVHRDIKPSNILVTEIGGEPDFVKLLDFGIAKHGVLGEAVTLTNAGMLIGTPAYMSPEQASSGHVDSRADLYALGAVLFHALTGRPLFLGSAGMLVAAHLSGVPPVPSAYSPHFVHPLLDSVVRTCLAKKPDDRFATALELDAALAAVPIAPEDYVSWSVRPPSPSLMPIPTLTPAARDCATVRPGPADSGERLIRRRSEAPLLEYTIDPRIVTIEPAGTSLR